MKKITLLLTVFAVFSMSLTAQTTLTNTGPATLDGSNCGVNALCSNNGCVMGETTVDGFDINISGATAAATVTQICFEVDGIDGISTFDLSRMAIVAPDGATLIDLFLGSCVGGTGTGEGCVLSDYVGNLCFEVGGTPQPVTGAGTYEAEGGFANISAITPVNGNWTLAIVGNECNNGLPSATYINWSITIDETLSVEENILEDKVSLYPNPVTDVLKINLATGITVESTELYSITGKLIYSGTNDKTIDVSNLNSGIYMLKISTDNGQVIKKIIKE
jgi:hypothetical protein